MSIQTLLFRGTISAAIVGLAAIVAIVVYTIENGSGHTGAHPWDALYVFVPILLVGMCQIVLSRRVGSGSRCGVLAVIIGLVGIVLLIYLDVDGVLLHYDEWAERYAP